MSKTYWVVTNDGVVECECIREKPNSILFKDKRIIGHEILQFKNGSEKQNVFDSKKLALEEWERRNENANT